MLKLCLFSHHGKVNFGFHCDKMEVNKKKKWTAVLFLVSENWLNKKWKKRKLTRFHDLTKYVFIAYFFKAIKIHHFIWKNAPVKTW